MDLQNLDETTKWDAYARMLNHFLSTPDNNIRIQNMIARNLSRLSLNLDDIRKLDQGLCQSIISTPIRAIKLLQTNLQTIVDELRTGGAGGPADKKKATAFTKEPNYRVTFEGNLGRNLVTPRGLSSAMVHNLVGVQGIVTRISLVRPKLVKSMHYCDKTNMSSVKEYNDDYDLSTEKNYGISNAFPLKDIEGNPLTCEFGYSLFKDFQTIVLQEMPENAPTGLLPRSVEVVLEEDLADKVKPGDRVQAVGVYKAVATAQTTYNGYFRVVLVATSINVLATDLRAPTFTTQDIKNIKSLSERKDLFDLLSKSIAPSIQGHEFIKKGILLMLFGGVEKTLENNTHLRGDINILIIGDPSTAKSQLLRHVLNIAPLAINTTGRGSSGVGLTAAVCFDKDTGQKHLEAGAMVLADRGIVCIDEFDKMNEVDRVSIHEVMEQQTVTIAKAGIHTSLNARCSVIAAANPIYGEYQKDLPPTKNIGLPDSLLSRFDLLYVVLDEKSSMHDRKVAERVTKNHRYIAPNQNDLLALGNFNEDNYVIEPQPIEEESNKIFEKFNHILHSDNQKELVSQPFLKKYIYYAKKSFFPVLEDESIEYIAEAWNKLRQKDMENSNISGVKNLSITIRTLETLIRLASAHAKLRLSKKVEKTDCFVALNLLKFALFNELMDSEEEEEVRNQLKINEEEIEKKTAEKSSQSKGGYSLRGTMTPKKLEEEIEKEVKIKTASGKKPTKDEDSSSKQLKRKMKQIKLDEDEEILKVIEDNVLASVAIGENQIKYVFKMVSQFFSENRKGWTTADDLWILISEKNDKEIKIKDELLRCLVELDARNKLMYTRNENKIYSLN